LFIFAHILLRFRPLHSVRARLARIATRVRARATDTRQLAWSADRVADFLPGRHSCLIKALVCDAVASASGIPVSFRIGAARSANGHRFHAWVEHRGESITGHEHAGFVPFADV
ncbi:MAG TPA: lasso peptide biosynthesis B2 protein, partial [Longimicrobiales bacterium]